MSGGYFEYKDCFILDFIDKLEEDIKYNDIRYENDCYENDNYGHKHSKKTIRYLKKLIKDCEKCANLLHSYDWYVSGDTSEEKFLEDCKNYYK